MTSIADGRAGARQHRRGDRRGRARARACRWRRRCCCSMVGPRSRTTCSRRCTPRTPTASRSRRRSRLRGRAGRDRRPSSDPPPVEEITEAVLEALADEIGRTRSTKGVSSRPPTSTRACCSAPASRSSSAASRRTSTRRASRSECWGGAWPSCRPRTCLAPAVVTSPRRLSYALASTAPGSTGERTFRRSGTQRWCRPHARIDDRSRP